MERRRGHAVGEVSALDRVYLRRACELAERGRAGVSPNPAVGAVIVRGTTTLGEGYHRVRGEPHAEVEALRDAASRNADVRGATLYVTLEPCNHQGLTPPCTQAILDAGIGRVVVGARDPNPAASGGDDRLLAAGVSVALDADAWARAIVEPFVRAVAHPERPYVRLKLAVSLDGFVAPAAGRRHWLTGDAVRAYVRDARAAADAVLVGAGTVRVDDPELTARPPSGRRKLAVRVVACEDAPVPRDRAIFAPAEGYARTIVLAPAARRERFADLDDVADVAYVESGDARDPSSLDLAAALALLRARGIANVLCEGGPTLAGRLLERDLVDRIEWLIAPVLLGGPEAVPALGSARFERPLRFDSMERLGPDLRCSVPLFAETSCSAV